MSKEEKYLCHKELSDASCLEKKLWCERFPGRPRMDIALVIEQLDDVKQLVQSAMEELKPRR